MIDLTPYLNILGLPAGATWDQVERRYRTLVIFWHPDRVSSPHHKALAEEELKKINNAKDKLKEHWRDWQNRPRSSTSYSQGSSSRANNAKNENAEKKNQDKKRADDEARRKHADFEAAYQHYASSRQERKEEEATHHRLGLRLLRVALIASAGLLVVGISSETLANQWISNLSHEEKSWTLSKREPNLQRLRVDSAQKSPIQERSNAFSPFAPPIPPPK